MQNLSTLENDLNYRFNSSSLLEEALTHGSAKLLEDNKNLSNQRLEFLGDAILGAVIAEWVYHLYPEVDEGKLTKYRTILINSNSLYQIGTRLSVSKYAIIHPRERDSGLLDLPATIEDFVESIIGAIYLDGGWQAAQTTIKHLFGEIKTLIEEGIIEFNPKGQLQEWAQAHQDGQTIEYKTISIDGPDHNRTYTVKAILNDKILAKGTGSSKKSAQTEAAKEALERISNT